MCAVLRSNQRQSVGVKLNDGTEVAQCSSMSDHVRRRRFAEKLEQSNAAKFSEALCLLTAAAEQGVPAS